MLYKFIKQNMINYLLEEIWFMTRILTWFIINTGNKILPILNHKKRKTRHYFWKNKTFNYNFLLYKQYCSISTQLLSHKASVWLSEFCVLLWCPEFVHKWTTYSVTSLNFTICVWISKNLIFLANFWNNMIIRYLWLFSWYI